MNRIFIILIFILGFALRFAYLSDFPQGINQDEAYSAYEAFSISNYGHDSWGYSNPMHSITWGSGMYSLHIFSLTIPIKIFGLSIFAMRFAQAFFGCFTLIAFYFLLSLADRQNKKFALLATLFLAINPWHIMMSRWGLDSNFIVPFFMLGMLFLTLGFEKPKFLILSALFYGLSLYGHPSTWIIVPSVIFLSVCYGLLIKKILLNKYSLAALALLIVMAIPIFLDLLVNYGYIEEIKTSLVSIPKMFYWRSGNLFSLEQIPQNIFNVSKVLLTQSDGNLYNALPFFGMHYFLTIPFAIYGFCLAVKTSLQNPHSPSILFLIQFIASLPYVLLLKDPNINRLDCLHIPIIFFSCFGAYNFCLKISDLYKAPILSILAFSYFAMFAGFMYVYFNKTEPQFVYGFEKALTKADEQNKSVCVKNIMHPVLLFTLKYPTDKYMQESEWGNLNNEFNSPKRIGKFFFNCNDNKIEDDFVYIFEKGNSRFADKLKELNFDISIIDNFIFAENARRE